MTWRTARSRGRTTPFNPWRGCTKVSAGCALCYAERDSKRNPAVLGVWGPDGTRVTASYDMWQQPRKWDRAARAAGTRARVFCASLADVFEGPETMPTNHGEHGGVSDATEGGLDIPNLGNTVIETARRTLFRLIDQTPNLDWLLLTKRPENVMPLYGAWLHWDARVRRAEPRPPARQRAPEPVWPPRFPDNVWIGTTAENQECADRRLPVLCRIPARVRFVSVEPQLGPVDLRPWLDRERGANWVICGGESGGQARPFDTNWARMLRDQCGDAGIPYFMKQLGNAPVQLTVKGKGTELDDLPEDLRVREFPN